MILEKIYGTGKSRLTVIYIGALICIILAGGFYFTESTVQEEKNQISVLKQNNVRLLASLVETKIGDASGLLVFASKDPSMHDTMFSSYISASLHGIPDHYDQGKRYVAQRVLESNGDDFESIRYVMPNGDIYLAEPYGTQENFQQLNYAYRDWYKGGVNANTSYVSEGYVAQSVKKMTVAIEVPIYSDDGKLVGLFGGVFKLDSLGYVFSHLNLDEGRRIILADQNGNLLYDTNDAGPHTAIKSVSDMDSVKQALSNKEGTIVESLGSTKMFSVYRHVNVGTNTWVIVLTQPYDMAFHSALTTQRDAYAIILATVAGIMVFSYLMREKVKNDTLLREMTKIEKQKDEFASMVSHELKSPLVPIIGYCEMLKSVEIMGSLTTEQSDAVDEIYKNSTRLQSLISDVLDVRKLELRQLSFYPEDTMTSQIIEDIKSRYEEIMKSRKIDFYGLCSMDCMIITDKNKINQVFDNLIQNAIDFVPKDNGRITVGARLWNDEIMFYVQDNGIGIPVSKQKNLFKKFYQVDSSLTREHQGTGLGLAICKEVVEALGGKIWVESEENRGSMFCFTLPCKCKIDSKIREKVKKHAR